MKFVEATQRLSCSLDEIGQLQKLDDDTHCGEAAEIAGLRLADVCARLEDLPRMETALSELVRACHATKGNISCPLIASLQGERALPNASAE